MDVYNLHEQMVQDIFCRVPFVTPEILLFRTTTSRVDGCCVKSISEQRAAIHFTSIVRSVAQIIEHDFSKGGKPEAEQGASWL